ncbi:MAG TPA: hypothetical protein VLZ83_05350 [Edaphocola sp.]|nr:hypothetical protein [Edaphocola sp.]
MVLVKFKYFCILILFFGRMGIAQTQLSFCKPREGEEKRKPYRLCDVQSFLVVINDTLLVPKLNNTMTFQVGKEISMKIENSNDSLVTICFISNHHIFILNLERQLFEYNSKNRLDFIFFKKNRKRDDNGILSINGWISRPISARISKCKGVK